MTEISEKSRGVASILAFLLGPIGVHRFYAGKIGSGIIMLILSCTIILLIVSAIWSLIDFVLILSGEFTDKHGRLIKKWWD